MARGDQIYVFKEFLNIQGVYEHHGIDCGDGTVIHYRKRDEMIARTSVASFTQGEKVYVKHFRVSFLPDAVVHRAESRLGEQKYNLLFNNCEHFATWCKTGISESQQVKDFLPLLSQIKVDDLYEPIKQSLQEANRNKAMPLLNQALAEIKVAWDNIQPSYNETVEEINTWHRVAILALKQGREDLARAAIERKLKHQQRATEQKAQLDKLATMTETLVRNSQNLQPIS